MIVTADPHGDFNATSQILRYSALAREITVPRIPSITQTILAPIPPTQTQGPNSSPLSSPTLHQRPFFPPGSTAFSPPSPNLTRTFSPSNASDDGNHRGTMELAALEIARLAEETEYLRAALQAEQSARTEAEAHLLSMEDRMLDLEQVIREDCAAEFERRLEIEMARWRATMQVEMERGEEHFGRKIEVFARVAADGEEESEEGEEDKENVLVEDVYGENERLRRDNEILRRELAGMSPSKRMPLRERGSDLEVAAGSPRANGAQGLQRKMERLRVSDDGASSARSSAGGGSPTKKVRKLGVKRWDSGIEDDDMF